MIDWTYFKMHWSQGNYQIALQGLWNDFIDEYFWWA